MSDLSQEELDALLDEAAESEASEGSAADAPEELVEEVATDEQLLEFFDFAQPHALSRSFDRVVRNICESFAKGGTLGFTNLVRCNCVISFTGLKLESFGQAFEGVENPSCIGIFSAPPLAGPHLLCLDAPILFSLFTKLLGGPIENTVQVRDFTDIETKLAAKVLAKLLEQFQQASEKVVKLEPELVQIESNPNYLNVFSDGETVLNLQYTIALEEVTGRFSFLLPLASFEPVRQQFDPTESLEQRTRQMSELDRRRVRESLESTAVELSVRLGRREMAMAELNRLQPGDVLALHHATSRPLDVSVEGDTLFEGILGQIGSARAVRIVRKRKEA